MIDLRAKDRQTIEQIATKVFDSNTELWAYGSRVTGRCHDASDLDLVVKPAENAKLDLDKLIEFKESLNDSTIPILIQVFSWAHIPKSFRENIMQRHEVLMVVDAKIRFGDLYESPSRNGLTKPKRVRGNGVKFINMGEIFAFDRMLNIPCDRAPLTDREKETSLMRVGDLLFARQSLVLSGAGKCSIFMGDKEPVKVVG